MTSYLLNLIVLLTFSLNKHRLKINPSFIKPIFASLYMLMVLVIFSHCTNKSNVMKNNKRKDQITENNRLVISTPVVVKKFVKKNGEVTQKKEIYIRRSIQDYFIKFCESKVSYHDLENHLAEINDLIKVVTLEIEFRNGNWDNCDESLELQSRVGKYVIVHKIITK